MVWWKTSTLRPALAGDVDAVIHAGDVFDRSRVTPAAFRQRVAAR